MNGMEGLEHVLRPLPTPAARPGEFVISAIGLEHGHIYGMVGSLLKAGATLKYVYDRDPAKAADFCRRYPQTRAARCEEEILADKQTQLVASAAITSERCPLGLRVMAADKDFFVDKGPMTTLDQLAQARRMTAETGRKYMGYYSERLSSEAATLAGYLVQAGEIGRVIHTEGFGPHRLSAPGRPAWFFDKARYGGILCDIGSHQIEQFLFFTGNEEATVASGRVDNYAHPETPELEDFGDCSLTGANGATGYCRVDWFTPDVLKAFGDGRTFLLGTEGYIELRKNVDIATDRGGDQLYLVNRRGERRIDCTGLTGAPFFSQLIRDCLERTETAMTQEHAFKAAELCLQAQAMADQQRNHP